MLQTKKICVKSGGKWKGESELLPIMFCSAFCTFAWEYTQLPPCLFYNWWYSKRKLQKKLEDLKHVWSGKVHVAAWTKIYGWWDELKLHLPKEECTRFVVTPMDVYMATCIRMTRTNQEVREDSAWHFIHMKTMWSFGHETYCPFTSGPGVQAKSAYLQLSFCFFQ